LKVSLIHMKTASSVEEALSLTEEKIAEAARLRPNFIVLPEYFSVPHFIDSFPSAQDIFNETYDKTINFLERISKINPEIYFIGGTLIEKSEGKFYNVCTIWKSGVLLGKYWKRNLIDSEVKIGISKGHQPLVISTEHCKVGVLICADIFDEEAVKQTLSLGAEVIFLPVAASSTHPSVKGHPLSEKIASENGVFIVKVGNVRSNARGGRSAVIAPWEVIEEAPDTPHAVVLTVNLDINKLRLYKSKINR